MANWRISRKTKTPSPFHQIPLTATTIPCSTKQPPDTMITSHPSWPTAAPPPLPPNPSLHHCHTPPPKPGQPQLSPLPYSSPANTQPPSKTAAPPHNISHNLCSPPTADSILLPHCFHRQSSEGEPSFLFPFFLSVS